MCCADPVQDIVHGVILEFVGHLPAHPSRPHPTLLPKYAQRLRDGILRAADRRRQITNEDPWDAMQGQ